MSTRSSEKRITRKAIIIRHMRQSRGVSLNQAGRLGGVTGPAIAHMEQGRMDISEPRLQTLVQAYGYTWDEYRAFADGKPIPISYRDECFVLLGTLDEAQLQAVHGILVYLTPHAGAGRDA